jgi:hypothetical protein
MRRHPETEPHIHAGRVALDGRLEKPLDLGESDYLVELLAISRRVIPRIAPLR